MLIFPVDHLPRLIPVGVQTSKGVEEIGFNVSAWLDKWPEMTFEVWPTRPTETAAYPAVSQLIGDVLVWYVSEADTAFDGLGTVEIVGIAEGIRKLSGPCTTEVKKTSLGATQEPPEGIKPYYEGMMEAAQDVRNAADEVTGGKALFVITTEIVNGKLIANRTIQEIQQATVSGRAVILANGSEVYTFIGYQKDNESGTGSIPTFVGKVEVNDKGILYAWNAQIRADGTVTAYSKAKKVVNPKKLHITGAVEASYDGSEEVTVEIPQGGGSAGLVVTIGPDGEKLTHGAQEIANAVQNGVNVMMHLPSEGFTSLHPVERIIYAEDGSVRGATFVVEADAINARVYVNNDKTFTTSPADTNRIYVTTSANNEKILNAYMSGFDVVFKYADNQHYRLVKATAAEAVFVSMGITNNGELSIDVWECTYDKWEKMTFSLKAAT